MLYLIAFLLLILVFANDAARNILFFLMGKDLFLGIAITILIAMAFVALMLFA